MNTQELGAEFIQHHGVLGMKWGVRKERLQGGLRKTAKGIGRAGGAVSRGVGAVLKEAELAQFRAAAHNPELHRKIAEEASTNFVKNSVPALKKKHGPSILKPFSPESKAYRKDAKVAYLGHLERAANKHTNTFGTHRYTLKEKGKPNTSSYFWNVHTEQVVHAIEGGSHTCQPIFDSNGYITDLKTTYPSMTQSAIGEEFVLAHFGAS